MKEVLLNYTQPAECHSGGIHTPPEFRLMVFALGTMLQAKDILETGYDAGFTTEALAHTGANVVGVDNLSEYGWVEKVARERLAKYPNVSLLTRDALAYLRGEEDASYDLVFVDDSHDPIHVRQEAVEVRRILRPGGIALFHDTIKMDLWTMVTEVFQDWHYVQLPCYSPNLGDDFGVGMVRKPNGNGAL